METENTFTPARWRALERACHPLHSLVSVSFSRFVLCLSAVQVLCSLAGVVLEFLLRPEEICVPLLSFLVHVIRDLALPHDVLHHRLVFVLVLELFLREIVLTVKRHFSEPAPCSSRPRPSISLSPGPSGQFQTAPNLDVSSLRECGFDTRHLCSHRDIVHLDGHWHTGPGVCARRGLRSATKVRCLLDVAVHHFK